MRRVFYRSMLCMLAVMLGISTGPIVAGPRAVVPVKSIKPTVSTRDAAMLEHLAGKKSSTHEKDVRAMLEADLTRALSIGNGSMVFGVAAPSYTSSLFLGSRVNAGTGSLMRADLVQNADNSWDIGFTNLATSSVLSGAVFTNPNNLVLTPTVPGSETDALLIAVPDNTMQVFMISNPFAAASETLTTISSAPLQDSTNKAISGAPLAVAASDTGLIFAVIQNSTVVTTAAPNGYGYPTVANVTKPELAIIRNDGSALTQLGTIPFNLVPSKAGNANAAPLPTPAFVNAQAAAQIDSALITTPVELAWSVGNGVLYIAFSNITRGKTVNSQIVAAPDRDGGVVSLMVASFNTKGDLVIKSVVNNPSPALITQANNGKQPYGFYAQAAPASSWGSFVYNVAAMRNDSSNNYVIFNGGTATNGNAVKQWVFALPTFPANTNNAGQLVSVDSNGLPVIDVLGNYKVPAAAADLPVIDMTHAASNSLTAAEQRFVVGANPALLGTATIQSMWVEGDTVYVATDQGIFGSSGIVDATGWFSGWTPWQRMTSGAAYAGGNDRNSLGFMWLSTANGAPGTAWTTVNATVWNQQGSTNLPSNISTLLEAIFPAGPTQVFSLDEYTPSFAQGSFSMLAFIDGSTVALLQSGSKVGTTFVPTTNYVLGQNALVFTANQALATSLGAGATFDAALAGIGTITGLDVLRDTTTATSGYLYVCGSNGLVRLQDASAKGWDNKAGLANLASIAGFTFRSLGDFSAFPFAGSFTKMIASDNALYLASNQGLTGFYFVKLNRDGSVAGSLLRSNGGAYFIDVRDFVVVNNTVVLSGQSFFGVGIFVTRFNVDADGNVVIAQLFNGLPAALSNLTYVSQTKGVTSSKGMLFAALPDSFNITTDFYRFSLDATQGDVSQVITPVDSDIFGFPVALTSINGLLNLFLDDSVIAFGATQQSPAQFTLIREEENANGTRAVTTRTQTINGIDLGAGIDVGQLVRDSASGSLFLPTTNAGLLILG